VSIAELTTGAVVIAAFVLAPLLVGAIQRQKAYLQGRVGASALQPYRELRRLWHKHVVQPSGTTIVYALAPAVCAAALAAALLAVPPGGDVPQFGVGHDALVVVGLLALARAAVALSAWDTTSGFGLMSAGRDLTFAVAGEALLLLVLATAALPVGSTDLAAMWQGASGADIWMQPAHWCGLAGMLLIVLLETGRQPVDNPDTHLELTMVHEGPLLEYAGRDLAYLQWAAAARHWVVLVLAAGLFLPHPQDAIGGMAVVLVWVAVLTAVLALLETCAAKLRLLRVPALTGGTAALALVGIVTWIAGISL